MPLVTVGDGRYNYCKRAMRSYKFVASAVYSIIIDPEDDTRRKSFTAAACGAAVWRPAVMSPGFRSPGMRRGMRQRPPRQSRELWQV